MKSLSCLWLILIVALVGGTVCANSSNPSGSPLENPSFSGNIQPIFNKSCAVSGCHNAAASGGLALSSGRSYGSLVRIVSSGDGTKIRVIPFNAPDSYLVMKLEGSQTVGAKMPLIGSVSGAEIQNIKNWISKGAPND
ncbi:MAG: hypothetical protein ACYDH3_08930 [Candidatus Aminicenantales bacterium]